MNLSRWGWGSRASRLGLLVLVGLAAPALAASGPGDAPRDPFDTMGVHRPAEPAPAPDLAFRSLDGREARLRDLRGKVVLLGLFRTD